MKKKIFALGFFDGVHLGHQALLSACCRLAAERKALACAVTFDLLPSAVLQNSQPNMLNTVQDRKSLLLQCGMDEILLLNANSATLSMAWDVFLETLVAQGAAGFVCGYDFRFGKNGEGNAEKLSAFAEERGLPWYIVDEQTMNGARISSTRIRTLIEKGDMEGAKRLLGHFHRFTGKVVHGRGLGHTIGIPTANLCLPKELVCPAFGVYACKAVVDGNWFNAVTNIGTRPTVNGQGVTVEPWILDFDGDLYGKEITLEFHKFLRPEQKFNSLEELKAQIHKDASNTNEFLK